MALPIPAPYTALIVGGTGAIGRAIATKFASLSSPTSDPLFNVCIISRKGKEARNVAALLPWKETASVTQQHSYVHGPVTHSSFWYGLAQDIGPPSLDGDVPDLEHGNWRRHGRLIARDYSDRWEDDPLVPLAGPTVLVNAAGLVHRGGLYKRKADDIREEIDANLLTTIWACRSLHRWMATKGKRELQRLEHANDGGYKIRSPSIVNFSSIIGTHGGAGAAVYAATKGAVLSFSRALAEEYGRTGIRVNTVVPGMIDTPMALQGVEPQILEKIRASIPLQRFGTIEEVADAVAFLVGNEYANNCVLNIDGGLSARSVAKD